MKKIMNKPFALSGNVKGTRGPSAEVRNQAAAPLDLGSWELSLLLRPLSHSVNIESKKKVWNNLACCLRRVASRKIHLENKLGRGPVSKRSYLMAFSPAVWLSVLQAKQSALLKMFKETQSSFCGLESFYQGARKWVLGVGGSDCWYY